MVLTGTIVNAAAIVAGGLVGVLLKGFPEAMGKTIMQGIGLAVTLLGLTMGFKTDQFLILTFSLVLGGVIGEWVNLENLLVRLGDRLEKRFSSKGKGSLTTAFVTATLIYSVGSMAILGALDSGLRNDHQILFTKSLLDGTTSIILASTLGIGVIFSAVPVFLYQGLIAVLAQALLSVIDQDLLQKMIQEITATGGLLIVGIGLNLLEITQIRVANLLPSIFVAALLVILLNRFPIFG